MLYQVSYIYSCTFVSVYIYRSDVLEWARCPGLCLGRGLWVRPCCERQLRRAGGSKIRVGSLLGLPSCERRCRKSREGAFKTTINCDHSELGPWASLFNSTLSIRNPAGLRLGSGYENRDCLLRSSLRCRALRCGQLPVKRRHTHMALVQRCRQMLQRRGAGMHSSAWCADLQMFNLVYVVCMYNYVMSTCLPAHLRKLVQPLPPYLNI